MDKVSASEQTTPSQNHIVLSVDTMGGDYGPKVVIEGIARAHKDHTDVRYILHGPQDILRPLIRKQKLEMLCDITHVEDVISMTDKPSHVIRHGKGSSMYSAIEQVKNKKADACVSCGNTGALMALSTLILRKMPNVNRPAIAILWPSLSSDKFNVMLDVGADVRASAHDLMQYTLMGVSYMRNGFGTACPRVGLLNVGTEKHKGRSELKEAHDLIEQNAQKGEYSFVGFVEGNDIPSDKIDIIVTDGFTGNVALKTAEGTALFIRSILTQAFKHTILSRFAAIIAYRPLRKMSQRIDPRRVNGGVFLGLNGTIVKSHGAADATGVAAAIRLACRLAKANFGTKIAERVTKQPINMEQ